MNRFKNVLIAALLAAGLVTYGYSQNYLRRAEVVYYAGSLPSHGEFAGQIAVQVDSGSDITVSLWNPNDDVWEPIAGDDAALAVTSVTASGNVSVTGDLDVTGNFSGAVDLTGDVTLGSNEEDTITLNGPFVRNVLRDDFGFAAFVFADEDFTAVQTTDTSENMLILWNSNLGPVHYRHEQAFAGTANPFPVAGGRLDLDGWTDAVNNDGIDMTFGGKPDESHVFHETLANQVYCKLSLKIGDISGTDSLYFGFHTSEAYQDAGAFNSLDTYAFFVISDNAGDLDIETELNGGGTLNDDTGITWADGEEKVLKVVAAADAVTFFVDGTAVTQTNAVLNFDDNDEAVCGFGFLHSAEGATPDLSADYLEIGVSQ